MRVFVVMRLLMRVFLIVCDRIACIIKSIKVAPPFLRHTHMRALPLGLLALFLRRTRSECYDRERYDGKLRLRGWVQG